MNIFRNTVFKTRRKFLFYVGFIALPVVQFAVFYVGVNFNSILLAFRDYTYADGYGWAGFDNFKRLFTEELQRDLIRTAFKNSAILLFFTLIVGITLALLFSYYIYKKMPASGVFKVILFLPSIVSSVVLVIMFKYFVENALPALWHMLTGKNTLGLLGNLDTRFGTIIFYTVWAGFGPQILMFSGAMSGISEAVTEAAKMDGITPVKEFTRITVPMIWPTLVTFIVVGIAGLFTHQMNLFSFYGSEADYSLYTVGYYLYRTIQSSSTTISEYPMLSAFGLFLTAVSVVLTFASKWLLDRFGPRTV